jgi:hypothetical protein
MQLAVFQEFKKIRGLGLRTPKKQNSDLSKGDEIEVTRTDKGYEVELDNGYGRTLKRWALNASGGPNGAQPAGF